MSEAELARDASTDAGTRDNTGFGALTTERGNLPLELIDLRVRVSGLSGAVELTQGFTNPYDQPLEATYIFPLPDRFAVTGMRMTADDRVIDAVLQERAVARAEYERAVMEGRRASIAEQERPDVFTMRVGNILPGERVSIALTLAGSLSYEDGEATFRFPLVVAPRYIPGTVLPGQPVGDGHAADTDAVPDASPDHPAGAAARLSPSGAPGHRGRAGLRGAAALRGAVQPAHRNGASGGDPGNAGSARRSGCPAAPAIRPAGTPLVQPGNGVRCRGSRGDVPADPAPADRRRTPAPA
jgi:hypothetical protein